MQVNEIKHEFGVRVIGWALRVCGLSAIQDLMLADKNKLPDNDDKLLEGFDCNYYGAYQGNIMFALSSNLLASGWKNPKSFYGRLLHYPGTRVIHWYKNNAHGPSLVFICMIHRFPDDVARPDWKNNVEYYAQRLLIDCEYAGDHKLDLPPARKKVEQ